jgi:hypothetical protein
VNFPREKLSEAQFFITLWLKIEFLPCQRRLFRSLAHGACFPLLVILCNFCEIEKCGQGRCPSSGEIAYNFNQLAEAQISLRTCSLELDRVIAIVKNRMGNFLYVNWHALEAFYT